jgi:hypothetical protein
MSPGTLFGARHRSCLDGTPSLNFCVFADLLADAPENGLRAVARTALRAGDRFFQHGTAR